MSKVKTNYIVDIVIMIAFLLTGISGVVLLLVPGGRGLSQYVVLGLPRAGWVELHDWAGIGTMIGVFLHFVLHWKWFVCVTRTSFSGLRPRAAEAQCPVTAEMNPQDL